MEHPGQRIEPSDGQHPVLYETLVAGTCASLLSVIALSWAGHREIRSPAAPLNAISHWRWGAPALRKRGVCARHTALGYAIHHSASLWWAGLHAALMQRRSQGHKPAMVLAGAAVTSAMACAVDFKCMPQRFTPGFERHLSRASLAGVYAVFAVGLALGAFAVRARRSNQP